MRYKRKFIAWLEETQGLDIPNLYEEFRESLELPHVHRDGPKYLAAKKELEESGQRMKSEWTEAPPGIYEISGVVIHHVAPDGTETETMIPAQREEVFNPSPDDNVQVEWVKEAGGWVPHWYRVNQR